MYRSFNFIADLEQQKIAENTNHALILIRDNKHLYVPNIVEEGNDQPIFKHDSSQNVSYWCPIRDPNMIALIIKHPKEATRNEANCLFETEFKSDQPKICADEPIPYLSHFRVPILNYDVKCGKDFDGGTYYEFKYKVRILFAI